MAAENTQLIYAAQTIEAQVGVGQLEPWKAQTRQELAQAQEQANLAAFNFLVTALGLTQSQLDLTANRIDAGAVEEVQLTASQLDFYVKVMRESQECKIKSDLLINEAARQTAPESTDRRKVVIG